jgi:Fic family protein
MEPLPEPLQAFEWPTSGPIAEFTARVDALVARYRQHRDAGRILPNSVEAMRVELTYHSNAIEGSTLTLRDTQLIIEGREPNTGKSLREIYEARNHDIALRLIEKWSALQPLPNPLTERDILAVHAQVMADIDISGAGRYRADRVLITGTRFVPPGPHKFPLLMPELCARANQAGIHPVLQAAELHYNLVAVHPFADGNGRTARLLMNYHLLRHGFPHVIVPVERRPDYLAALEAANSARCEPFAEFVLSCVHESIRRLIGED